MKVVLESNLAHWHGAIRGEGGDEDTAHEDSYIYPPTTCNSVSKLEVMFMLLVLSLLLPTL